MDTILRHLTQFQDVSGSTVLAAGDNLSATARTLVAGVAKKSVVVFWINVNVITDNAATLTFQDDAGTPIVIAGTKASPGIGPIVFNFGPDGRQLTEGQSFTLKNSAAGLAADITWCADLKPTGVRTMAQL